MRTISRITAALAIAFIVCLTPARAAAETPPQPPVQTTAPQPPPPSTALPAATDAAQPTPTVNAPLLTPEQIQMMSELLDRIDVIVTKARGDQDDGKLVGTSGKSPAEIKITIDAASLDEIRAEVVQLKKLLPVPLKRQP